MNITEMKKAINKLLDLQVITVTYGEYESSADGSIEYDVNVNVWFNFGDYECYTYKTYDNEEEAIKMSKYVMTKLKHEFNNKVIYEGFEK